MAADLQTTYFADFHMVSLNVCLKYHVLVECVLKVIHRPEGRWLHSNLTHSCVLQPVILTWSLCDAREWCRTAVCICSLYPRLCVGDGVCLGACVLTHTDKDLKLIAADVH